MKKVFTLILALALGFGLKAQCPLTTAVDFTATDVHGTEVHLFDILDGGQAVLIDFFFTTCGPCQQATPKIVESYYAMGCNMHDVFYMEIATGDSEQACLNWVNTYGVEYPTISGVAGGTQICNQYSIGAYPTVILIMPDRSIVINDLWPINNAQTVIAALEQHGLEQHDCNTPSYDPQVSISIDDVTDTNVTATFTPNEDCVSYRYMLTTESAMEGWVQMMGLSVPEIVNTLGILGEGVFTNTFPNLEPNMEFAIYAVPSDINGELGEVVLATFTTLPMLDETLTFSMDTVSLPWCEVTWITVYNNTAEDATIVKICDDRYELGFYHGPDAILSCNETEITIPQGGSIELGIECCVTGKSIVPDVVTISSNLADAQFVVMVDDTWSVDENEASVTLYPNPANDFVTLKGENLGTVRVYNVLGQKVDEFEANRNELRISTTGYENGLYVVKAGEQALRFVVKH
ncbi:MAG: redoxin domain-containing protein [Bacteroidales bacterium]|nr:redoxin domain-containing protein [Bacteroidales bacterium]MBR6974194.1 redoxin domain-containing protein [Bacteroidaceae bacterium]